MDPESVVEHSDRVEPLLDEHAGKPSVQVLDKIPTEPFVKRQQRSAGVRRRARVGAPVIEMLPNEDDYDVFIVCNYRVAIGRGPRVTRPAQVTAQLRDDVGPDRVRLVVHHLSQHSMQVRTRALTIWVLSDETGYPWHVVEWVDES
jgi:hypothetical protein